MVRLYQNFTFEVTEVAGRNLQRLCGLVDLESSEHLNSTILVFARLDQPNEWHQFFLDSGAAFWETWPDSAFDDAVTDESYHLIHYYDELLPKKIIRAHAFELSPNLATRISIVLDSGHCIQLAAIKDEPDADTILSINEQYSQNLDT